MIVRRTLKLNRNYLIPKMRNMYAVDSEVQKGLTYVANDGEFAIVYGWHAIWCGIEDLPELVRRCSGTEIYEEVKDIAYDVMNYRRDLMIYKGGGLNDD